MSAIPQSSPICVDEPMSAGRLEAAVESVRLVLAGEKVPPGDMPMFFRSGDGEFVSLVTALKEAGRRKEDKDAATACVAAARKLLSGPLKGRTRRNFVDSF